MGGRLEGKVALVTGAGNGIGRACAQRFAAEGASVVVAELLDDAAAETVAQIEAQGGTATAAHVDAPVREHNDAAAQLAVDRYGRLDILLTAAGISHAGYRSGDRSADAEMMTRAAQGFADPSAGFLGVDQAEWDTVLSVNLTGTFLAVQAATRHMVAAGNGGSIVTIASIAAKHPDAGPLAYTVSKAGVWMLTKHAARSLGPAGIRVNAIGPGFIETNMTRMITELEPLRERFLSTIPLRRMGQPSDIADAALFLASDEASYVTGEILHPDGGFYTE